MTFTRASHQDTVEGQLVEARCYFNTGATGGDHTYCAYSASRANLPLIIVGDAGQVTYVIEVPAVLADQVTARVRMRGRLTANRQWLWPTALWVWRDGAWRAQSL